jgi:hypothetical protein
LLALLRAVEENENDSSTAAPAAGPADRWEDWDAAADDDAYADDRYGHDRTARQRRPAAKRQRHTDYAAADEYYSESQSAETAAARRSVAISDESDAAGDDKGRYRKQRAPASGSLGAYVRYKHGAADDGYLYGDVLDRQVAAATGVVTGVKKGGKKARLASALPAAAAAPPTKRHRCVAGVNQWTTEDGLTVWPKVCGAGCFRVSTTCAPSMP